MLTGIKLSAFERGQIENTALAKTVESDFDEAILMKSSGKVSEASGMTIFLVRNGQLITFGVELDILQGITRDPILIIDKNLAIKIQQRLVDCSH